MSEGGWAGIGGAARRVVCTFVGSRWRWFGEVLFAFALRNAIWGVMEGGGQARKVVQAVMVAAGWKCWSWRRGCAGLRMLLILVVVGAGWLCMRVVGDCGAELVGVEVVLPL